MLLYFPAVDAVFLKGGGGGGKKGHLWSTSKPMQSVRDRDRPITPPLRLGMWMLTRAMGGGGLRREVGWVPNSAAEGGREEGREFHPLAFLCVFLNGKQIPAGFIRFFLGNFIEINTNYFRSACPN